MKGQEEIPSDPEAVAGKLSEVFGVSTNALLDLGRFRNGEKIDPNMAVAGLLSLLTDLVGSVDSMDG